MTMSPPEPGLEQETLVRRAAALRDILRERQEQTEMMGRLPVETLRDFLDAGFFRVLQPRRFGGYQFDLRTFLRITVELARGCPSSGWVFGLTATHNLIVGLFEEQAQAELFGDGDFRCPLVAAPVPATKVDGGYRIDAGWDYATGCDIATHFIGAIAVQEKPGADVVDTRFAAVRRDQFRIIDNWDVLGMRGTGSRRVVVTDLVVPQRHTVPAPNPMRAIVDFPGRGVHRDPAYYGPFGSLLICEPAAVCVGIARAAIDEYVLDLGRKHQWGPLSPLRGELSGFHRLLGEATAYLDTAEAALEHVAYMWTELGRRAMHTGQAASDEQDRRLIQVEQQVVDLAARAVDIVFRTAGSSATRRGSRIERYFRDLNMVRTHITLQRDRTWENVGRLRLGLTPDMAL